MNDSNVTWREMIGVACGEVGEDLLTCTLTSDEMDVEFDHGYGGTEGVPFTAWTESYVLFPICYDGAEWVGYAPRNPTAEALADPLEHQGGG